MLRHSRDRARRPMLLVVIVLAVDPDRLGRVSIDAVAVQVSIELLIAERAPPRLVRILHLRLPRGSMSAHAAPLAAPASAAAAFTLALGAVKRVALAGVRLDVDAVSN